MKWNAIKNRVAAEVFTQIIEGRSWETMSVILLDLAFGPRVGQPFGHNKVFAAYADKARAVILAWDVRCAGRLRDLFPGHFPPSLSKGNLVTFLDDESGEWLVEKATP